MVADIKCPLFQNLCIRPWYQPALYQVYNTVYIILSLHKKQSKGNNNDIFLFYQIHLRSTVRLTVI